MTACRLRGGGEEGERGDPLLTQGPINGIFLGYFDILVRRGHDGIARAQKIRAVVVVMMVGGWMVMAMVADGDGDDEL